MWDPKIAQLPDTTTAPYVAVVDPATGLPPGARTVVTARIPAGQSVSQKIDLANSALVGFAMPDTWTAAGLSIEVSVDDGLSWETSGVFDAAGVAAATWSSVVASAAYSVDVSTMLPWRYIRLRSGTTASPVAQAAQRDIVLITRPLA